MNTCSIKKLKVTFDNPNLPYFETMQQFTLNAIAASGNNEMTDAQKLALNHFFYRIGAINNTGIFAKLNFLYLPMICNSNLEKALVNYKNNVAKAASTVVFNNKGLLLPNSYSGDLYYNIEIGNVSYPVTDMCFASFSTVAGRRYSCGFRNGSSGNDCRIEPSSDCRLQFVEGSNSSYYGRMQNYSSEDTVMNGYVLNINGNGLTQGTFNVKAFLNTNEIPVNINVSTSVAITDLTTPYKFRLSFYKDYSESLTSVPTGAIMYGQALTDSEITTLNSAVSELRAAFVV